MLLGEVEFGDDEDIVEVFMKYLLWSFFCGVDRMSFIFWGGNRAGGEGGY